MLGNVALAIPAFHCYGHKVFFCQVFCSIFPLNTFEELKGIEKHIHAYSKIVIFFVKLCLVFCNARSTTAEDDWKGSG